jgi:uncharacterized membrane protein/predicted DsbA family dithiol-disulfide isomerase
MLAPTLALLAAVTGLVVSLLLSALHAQLAVGGAFCSPGSGCHAVLASSYSRVLGVPLAHAGVVFYSLALAAGMLHLALARRGSKVALVCLAILGTCASVGFVAVQIAVIRAVCPLCMTSAAASFLLLAATLLWRRRSARPTLAAVLATATVPLAAVAALYVIPRLAQTTPLARFGDQLVTLADVARDDPELLASLDRNRYEVLSGYLRRKLAGLAIAAEAKKAGMPPRELVAREVDSLIESQRPQVTDTATRLSPDDELRRDRIVRTMLADAREARMQEWVSELLAKYPHEVLLRPPLGRELAPDLAIAHRDGPESAPLKLVVFSDLQCPICAELDAQLAGLRQRLGDQLAVYFRHFPLRDHEFAEDAAVLAEAIARDNGREAFASYKTAVFALRGDLDRESLLMIAGQHGLSPEQARAALDDASLRARVRASAEEARALKLDGAPYLILNNRAVGGMLDLDTMEQRLRDELARTTR